MLQRGKTCFLPNASRPLRKTRFPNYNRSFWKEQEKKIDSFFTEDYNKMNKYEMREMMKFA